MEYQTNARGLDIFKLIVTLGLISALIYPYFQGRQVSQATVEAPILVPTVAGIVAIPTQKAALPEIPERAQYLFLDEDLGRLVSPSGVAILELDEAGTSWQPVVPPNLAVLSGGLSLAKDQAGEWILAAQDGIARYRWDENSLTFKESQDLLATLPEFPKTEVELKYDEVQGALVDPQNTILFRLDQDNNNWIPTVPDKILKQAGVTAPSQLAKGEWAVIDASGKILYTFYTLKATWEAIPEPAVELPVFPSSGVELTFDETTNQLLTPDGSAAYLLVSEAGEWIPVIPDDIDTSLPEGSTVTRDKNSWMITGPQGVSLYIWDASALLWVGNQEPGTVASPTLTLEPTTTPEVATCQKALPSRIQVGDTVRVTTSLNLRSSPGIQQNLIRSHPTGTTLEVIDGPECVPHDDGEYFWWNVRHTDGTTGWSAEGSITGKFYFLEPVNK